MDNSIHEDQKLTANSAEMGCEEACVQDAHELKVCQELLAASEERYNYLNADFENYRRRGERERTRSVREARVKMLREVVELVDTLERSLALCTEYQASGGNEVLTRVCVGIDLVYKQALKFLANQGVTVIQQTEQFDPGLHEALQYISHEGSPQGAIVAVLEKGYLLDGEVLRPARVSVAQ